MLGVDVNQGQIADDAGNNPKGTVAIGGTGITVTYTQSVQTAIRVQIQAPGGEASGSGGSSYRWCATLAGAKAGETKTETVLWNQFWGGVTDSTQGCWNNGGVNPPTGQLIEQVSINIPGGNTTDLPFGFCLLSIGQAS
jgi:hypothetical protein